MINYFFFFRIHIEACDELSFANVFKTGQHFHKQDTQEIESRNAVLYVLVGFMQMFSKS